MRQYLTTGVFDFVIPIVFDIVLPNRMPFEIVCTSILLETRAVRHYQSGHAGVRLAKGLYIGGSQGRSVSNQEWAQIDTGTLTITNKRLIFDGGTADRNVAISKIFSAESGFAGVEVSVDGRQKSMAFTADNPLILAVIIRVCSQADPFDISQTPLNFTFG